METTKRIVAPLRAATIMAVLLALGAVHLPTVWATVAGTVAPPLETSLIDSLADCDGHQRDALAALASFGDKERVGGVAASDAAGDLGFSATCLDSVLGTVLGTTPGAFDPKTLEALKDLQKNLKDAFKADGKAIKKIERASRAGAIRKEILKALDAKQAAKGNLQGTKGRRNDGPTHIPPSRFGIPGGPFFTNVYNANASARAASKPVKNAGWQQFADDNAKFKRTRVKLDDEKINIWEFRAKKRDLGTFIGFDLNRSFGPPTSVAGTIGTYTTKEKDLADRGNASVCYDVIRDNGNGSKTLQFYGVCVRPTLSGVTVERFTENKSVGTDVFPGARQVDLYTESNGSHFTTWAGPRGGNLSMLGTAVQAGWPVPWEHVRLDLQAFGMFGRSRIGVEGVTVFHDTR